MVLIFTGCKEETKIESAVKTETVFTAFIKYIVMVDDTTQKYQDEKWTKDFVQDPKSLISFLPIKEADEFKLKVYKLFKSDSAYVTDKNLVGVEKKRKSAGCLFNV